MVIEGHDLQGDLAAVYTLMGACPQHDLLWDGLTGGCTPAGLGGGRGRWGRRAVSTPLSRPPPTGSEHLLFYARIKGLAGHALRRAVDDALGAVGLAAVGSELVRGYR